MTVDELQRDEVISRKKWRVKFIVRNRSEKHYDKKVQKENIECVE